MQRDSSSTGWVQRHNVRNTGPRRWCVIRQCWIGQRRQQYPLLVARYGLADSRLAGTARQSSRHPRPARLESLAMVASLVAGRSQAKCHSRFASTPCASLVCTERVSRPPRRRGVRIGHPSQWPALHLVFRRDDIACRPPRSGPAPRPKCGDRADDWPGNPSDDSRLGASRHRWCQVSQQRQHRESEPPHRLAGRTLSCNWRTYTPALRLPYSA